MKNAGNNGYDHFRLIKNRFNENPNSLDFIFLSRAGFNGMMRFNKKGQWNIPFCKKPERFAQAYITKIVNQVAKVSHVIKPEWEFHNKQFSEIIPLAKKGDVIYCDHLTMEDMWTTIMVGQKKMRNFFSINYKKQKPNLFCQLGIITTTEPMK